MPTIHRPSRWVQNDARNAHRAAMAMQISLHSTMLDMMRSMGQFTMRYLTQTLVQGNPFVPRHVVERFAGEMVDEFHHLLDYRAGIYQLKSPAESQTREQTMQMFRDMANNVRVVDIE